MRVVKEEIKKIIQNLPDNCTFEDVQYHLYIVEKIKNSEKRVESGEVLTHNLAKKRVSKWLLS